jgi:hypothetical protein
MPNAVLRSGTEKLGPKYFPAPKRADLRGWWNAVRKVAPDWYLGYWTAPGAYETTVTEGSIIFRAKHRPEDWVLVIQRR